MVVKIIQFHDACNKILIKNENSKLTTYKDL